MEWISVKDRLPERSERILLVWAQGHYMQDVWCVNGEWYAGLSDRVVEGVTHWMPLPDAPRNISQQTSPRGDFQTEDRKDYMIQSGARSTIFCHVECDCPVYETTDPHIGICGHCASWMGLPPPPDASDTAKIDPSIGVIRPIID